MGYGRLYAFHTTITVATTVLTGALFYVLRIVFYQHLTPEQYGLFFSVFSFAMLAQPLLSFGFDPGLVPFVTQFREEHNPAALRNLMVSALAPQCALACLLAVGILASARVVSLTVFGTPEAAVLLGLLAVHAILIVLYKTGQQLLLGLQSLVWRNGVDLVRTAVCTGAGGALVVLGFGVEGAGLAYVLAAAAAVFTQLAAIAISHPILLRGRPEWRPGLTAQAFASGKFLSLAFGGVMVFSSLDTILITLVRGDLREAAAYQIALPTVTIVYSLMTAAGLSLMPMVRTLWYREQRELLADGISRIYEAAFVLMLPAGVLMAGFSDVLMHLLFGPNILNAQEAFNLLAVAGVFYFISNMNLHILAGIGLARGAAVAAGAALGLVLVLDPILIHFLGIRGAAVTNLIGYSTVSLLGYRVIRGTLPVRPPWKSALASLAVSPFLWGACQWIRMTQVFADHPLPAAGATAALLFVATMILLEVSGCARLRHLLLTVSPRGGIRCKTP